MTDLITIKCEHCGNDGGDDVLLILDNVVGRIVAGIKVNRDVPDGEYVTDDAYEEVVVNIDRLAMGDRIWCNACGYTTTPIWNDSEEHDA